MAAVRPIGLVLTESVTACVDAARGVRRAKVALDAARREKGFV